MGFDVASVRQVVGRPVGVGLAVVALVACSSPSPAPSSPPSVSVSATTETSLSGSTPTPSSSPTPTAPSSPTASVVSPNRTTASTPSPAPSTAGTLNSGTVPRRILDFTADNQARAAEGEFNPNGTFVHQVNASDASLAALPGCAATSDSLPMARNALAATYRDAATHQVGNVIQLRFATHGQAASWFSAFVAQVKQCPRVDMSPVATGTTVRDRRASGGLTWSEAGVVHEATVTLAALQGSHDTGGILSALG